MHTFSETGTGVPAFLAKLWRLVEDPETNNLIYWSRDGRSFIIQNQAQFARELLPMNYKHNNMASFIRQLNMYGFHKITSIDNGGLKFDRDEMEFSHPCFKRGYPYLLEHIKRKIANSKTTIDEKASLKPEAVSKVLNEVKVMRGRQDSLDSRFSAMKQENEALWREIAVLRQKHMKQQQIVNKLIQFLVTIVQPSRNMSGVKRHFQLMINDVPQSSRVRKRSESNSGPVIHELTEELLDEVAENDPEMMAPSPHVMSPSDPSIQVGSDMIDEIPSPLSTNERPRSQPDLSNIESDYQATAQNASGSNQNNAQNEDDSHVIYHITEVPEQVDPDSQFIEDNILSNPVIKKESNRPHPRGRKRKYPYTDQAKIAASQSKLANSNNQGISEPVDNVIHIKTEKDLDPLMFLEVSQDGTNLNPSMVSPLGNDNPNQASAAAADNNDKQMYISKEDFISTEMPTDLFEESSMLDDINLAGGYNLNADMKPKASESGETSKSDDQDKEKKLAVAKYNNSKYLNEDEILRLSTPHDINNHLDTVQEDLDNLKDLLRGDGYTFDANTLLGNTSPGNRIILQPSLDGDILAKLFSDSDVLAPYGLSLSNEQQDSTKKGSELMTYTPCYADLSDILDLETDSLPKESDYETSKQTPSSVLNTPKPERG